MVFGLLHTSYLCACFVADVKGKAADLGKNGGKGKQKGGNGKLFAVNAQKISAQQNQYDKHQGKQGGQEQIGFLSGHGSLGKGESVLIITSDWEFETMLYSLKRPSEYFRRP